MKYTQRITTKAQVILWALALVIVSTLSGMFLRFTQTSVARTEPDAGATDISTHTSITVFTRYDPLRGKLLGYSRRPDPQFEVYYADTGTTIVGSAWTCEHPGGEGPFRFKPKEPLRPNAPIIAIFRRKWECPYTVHFTTALDDNPINQLENHLELPICWMEMPRPLEKP